MLFHSSYNCSSASVFNSFGNTSNAISYSGSCCPCLKQHSNSKSGVKYGTSGLVQRHLSRLTSMRGMGVRTTDISEVSNQSKTTNNETLVSFENATFGTDYHTSLAQEYGKHPPGFTGNTIQFWRCWNIAAELRPTFFLHKYSRFLLRNRVATLWSHNVTCIGFLNEGLKRARAYYEYGTASVHRL